MQKVLIANRGEIALRIVRSCREAGIQTVGAYASVDKDLLHLKYADEIVCVSRDDYLCRENIIAAAQVSGCDAIHPGYGFLAEDAEFCRMVEEEGLTFIGPTSQQIAEMGDKIRARETFEKLGLNPVPGSGGEVLDLDAATKIAQDIGYPMLIKAAFGGGGRGIRVVTSETQFVEAFAEAKAEAESAFGDGAVYIEKFLDNARHIEVQILGDGEGNAIHLGTRECSVQRRQQKVIEEAPAPNIDADQIDALCARAVAAVAKFHYRNAGTLEFLYQDDEFYFLEMNTRIQVEHPVTEAVTGRDLIGLQLQTADEGRMSLSQDEICIRGCAIECRVNAEDDQYRPSPGLVSNVTFPGGAGVRVDSHLYAGYAVPHQFDSLVAKLISWDSDRSGAIRKMNRMLGEFQVDGIASNKSKLVEVINHRKFLQGMINTRFLDQLSE